MITVRLIGGMGNQMFQYALGRRLAERHNTILKLDTTFLLNRLPRKNFVFRGYDLNVFNIQESFTCLSRFAMIFNNIAFPLSYCYLRIKKVFYPNCIVKEKKDYFFDSSVLDSPNDIYLNGYWQSERYFKDIEHIVRKEFTFKEKLNGRGNLMADKIRNVNAVCVNIRRADYVTNALNNAFFGTISKEYYQRAEEIISSKTENPHFFIFSDDINWCKTNLKFNHPTVFVGSEYAGKKWQQYLQLMVMCKHFIIPNSTFAWWAAWLSENKDKIIIVPKKWVNDSNINTDDLIPSSWIRI